MEDLDEKIEKNKKQRKLMKMMLELMSERRDSKVLIKKIEFDEIQDKAYELIIKEKITDEQINLLVSFYEQNTKILEDILNK